MGCRRGCAGRNSTAHFKPLLQPGAGGARRKALCRLRHGKSVFLQFGRRGKRVLHQACAPVRRTGARHGRPGDCHPEKLISRAYGHDARRDGAEGFSRELSPSDGRVPLRRHDDGRSEGPRHRTDLRRSAGTDPGSGRRGAARRGARASRRSAPLSSSRSRERAAWCRSARSS